MSELRYTVKDSVFTFLFGQPEYLRELYVTLHPEDPDVTEADCKLITLQNVLSNGMYNDLGMLVRGKLILLVEAQSTFSRNITLRLLLYLAASYKDYVEENMLNLYSSTTVRIPRPELFVLYTGDRKNVPETLHLSELYEGTGSVDVTVTVLRDRGEQDIVDQYIRFCKVTDRVRKEHGYTKKAVEEIIRICLEEGILSVFLHAQQKEVRDIMVTLFDEKWIREVRERELMHNSQEKGRQEGRQEGLQKGMEALVKTLQDMMLSPEAVAETVGKRFRLSPEEARQQVDRYWQKN